MNKNKGSPSQVHRQMYSYLVAWVGSGIRALFHIRAFSVHSYDNGGENNRHSYSDLSTVRSTFTQDMPKICSVGGCTNHHMQKENLSFFKFPDAENDPERRARWIRVCGRQNPDGSEWIPTAKYVYICSQHFISGKPNSDPDHPDYIPSIYMMTADSSLQGAKRLNRYNSAQKRRFGLVADNKVTKKRKIEYGEKEENRESDSLAISGVDVMEANDVAVTSEIVNNTPAEDKQEVIQCTLPLHETERQMLMDEMDNLRYERNMFSKKLVDTETKLKTMQLSIELVRENDKKCKFYTGLSWDVFLKTFSFLDSKMSSRRRGNVPVIEQYFMTLVKLRQNPKFEYLADQCNLGKSTVIDTFWKWVTLIESQLGFMIHWPDRDTIFTNLPDVFKMHFPRLTNIIDCFEIFIENPKVYKAKAECYSNYKKHTTVKFLVACNPLGSVVFLSKAWGGRVSDIELSRKSGYISREFHHPGDQILADRGFTLQEDMATECSAELILPAFTKGKNQLSAREVEQSRKLSSVRIHIERVIGVLKSRFSILQGPLPIQSVNSIKSEAHNDILSSVDKIVRTCAILTNLGDGIVLSSDARGEKS